MTPKLKIPLLQPTDRVGVNSLNKPLEAMDDLLVGISHLASNMHWAMWEKSTAYNKDDVVRWEKLGSGQYARCVIGGTSGTTEPTINTTGSTLVEGTVSWVIESLGSANSTIDFWLDMVTYDRGQIVIYNNCLYRCKTPHTSSSSFDLDYSKWLELKTSVRIWSPSVYYYENDTALVDGSLYLCITAHVSESTFNSTEETYWEVIGGAGGISVWQDNIHLLPNY